MKFTNIILVPLIAVAAACGGSGSAGSASAAASASALGQPRATPSTPNDSEIAALVYDSSYSVPSGFYVDERSTTERSYTVHHVLDESSSFELCTDDYAEAMAWEAADNASRSVQGYFVESYDNERYFEFVRELDYRNDVGNVADISSPGFGRVFKCSSTNRNGVDRLQLNGYAGALNAHPLGPESVRVFAEYLWQFTFFPASRKKVIDSVTTETAAGYDHTLLLAFSTSQGFDRCDRIEVARWVFSADSQSGEVTRTFETVRFFEAEVAAGRVVVCD